MSSAHLHLLLNHFPVIGTIIIILVIGYGILKKDKAIIKTALLITVFISIVTIFAYTTGNGAQQMVEGMDDVTEKYIDEHEDAAGFSFIIMEILGGVSLIGLILFNKKEHYPSWFIAVIVFLLLATASTMARTANLGGKIHHPEIQKDVF